MDNLPASFGLNAGDEPSYVLRRTDTATALYEIVDGIERERVTAIAWSSLGPAVQRDWNARLIAKEMPPGAFPTGLGHVSLHRQFGRELDVLLTAAASHQEAAELLPMWIEATPAFRLRLWTGLVEHRADEQRFSQSAQWVQDELRHRAPDGSQDPEREQRIWARNKAAMDAVRAERAKSSTWRAATRSGATWNR